MKLAEAVRQFLITCRADGLSTRTVETYRQRFARLVSWLGQTDLANVTLDALRGYVVSLYDENLSVHTIHGHVRALRRLFNWLQAEGMIQSSPAASIRLPRLPSAPPKAISIEDARRMLRVAATTGAEWEQMRNLAILLFLADTGCRLQGLINLSLSDLDLERRMAKVYEKNSQWRFVFVKPETVRALCRWLEVRSQVVGGEARDAVWVGRHGRALGEWGVQAVLRRLRERAQVAGPAGAHSFRHLFAISYLLNGGDLATLADLLGHSDIETTKLYYARFKLAELQVKHDQHSPVSDILGEGDGLE